MTRRHLLMSCVSWLVAVPVLAQSIGKSADPLSGRWVDDSGNGRGLELKFDGKRKVTGTVNPGQKNAAPISDGTFDPKTGEFKLEGRAGDPASPFVIEGKLDKDVVSGTYAAGGNTGTFRFTRKKQ